MAGDKEQAQRFGAWLQRAIEARGLSGRQVAAYADVSPNTLHLWMRGAYLPRPASLGKLAPALGVPVGDLMRAAGYPYAEPQGPADPRTGGAEPVPLDPDERALIGWLRGVGGRGLHVTTRRALDVLRALYHADDDLFADLAGDARRRQPDEA